MFHAKNIPGISDVLKTGLHSHHFDKLGGVTLKLVYPTEQILTEDYPDIGLESFLKGDLGAHLANFGRYQFGSSITAKVYPLTTNKNACLPISSLEEANAQE